MASERHLLSSVVCVGNAAQLNHKDSDGQRIQHQSRGACNARHSTIQMQKIAPQMISTDSLHLEDCCTYFCIETLPGTNQMSLLLCYFPSHVDNQPTHSISPFSFKKMPCFVHDGIKNKRRNVLILLEATLIY